MVHYELIIISFANFNQFKKKSRHQPVKYERSTQFSTRMRSLHTDRKAACIKLIHLPPDLLAKKHIKLISLRLNYLLVILHTIYTF